ncbi:MAG: hypothetical protein HY902_21275 [Deltaproteobacteria bacterium]|nr:hypothetical protein [Deltaproteobacteria bacterium]
MNALPCRRTTALVCALGLSYLALPAFADIPPPNTAGCQSKSAGATCKTDGDASGSCVTQTCTKLDYAHWDKDASSSPPTRSYDCLKCELSTASTPTSGSGTTNSSGGSSCSAGPVGSALGALGLLGAVALLVRRRTAR